MNVAVTDFLLIFGVMWGLHLDYSIIAVGHIYDATGIFVRDTCQ